MKHFQQICAEYGIAIKSLTPYQHRFTIGGDTFDFYQISSKVNRVGTNDYFVVDIIEFIMSTICK